jgi:hypothetical protein
MALRRGVRTAAATLLIGASLSIGACGEGSTTQRSASVTVQLPPPRPYQPAEVKPGFSERLTGAVRG